MDFLKNLLLAKQEINQRTLRLKLKITLFVSLAAVIFFCIFIVVTFYVGKTGLLDKAVESQSGMTQTLASAVSVAIEKQVELLKLNANSQFVIDAVKQNNLKYRVMGEKEIRRYLMDEDQRWIEAPDDHPLIKQYSENKLSAQLKAFKVENDEAVNLLVTDKFGGLVGFTSRTSGFYSFDKDWWLGSYADGRGKPFIGNVEYDEQSSLWAMPFAVPIEDETRAIIGIYKELIRINTFFKPLMNFRIGRTGDAVVVDDKAYLVYHPKAAPFANKYCEYEELQNTLQNAKKWGILNSAYLNHGKKLAAYAEINVTSLPALGVNWFVFVERDLSEIFMPLNKLIFMMILIGIALTIILALSVFILSAVERPGSILQVIKDAPALKTHEESPGAVEKRRMTRLPSEQKEENK
ncbi:MAG: cache domain-containing protein [Candidatus Omnitrophica bacterium]|nr:cache domain-containing protein [Candidatus Omnitrophota bacterium]